MKIFWRSNLQEFIDTNTAIGEQKEVSACGKKKIESITSHFQCLGDIVTITTIEGSKPFRLPLRPITRETKYGCPLKIYTLEISILKIIALIALLPIFFLHFITCASNGLFNKKITSESIDIDCKRDQKGNDTFTTMPPRSSIYNLLPKFV